MIDRGKLPQGWEIKKLPEVLDFLPGKAHEPYVSENGEFTVANSKFVSTQGAVRKYATINVSPAEPGDILVVMSDLPNGRALGKAYLVGEGEKIAVNQRVCALRTKIGVPAFYHYQLDRSPYFLSFDDGINQTHLLNPIFENCPIVTAPLPEQRKIAEILSAWDEATRRLSSLLAAKRKRFSWLRTHVLSGRLRLPGFFGEWPILPLAVSLKENRLTSTGAEEVFSVSVHKG